MKVKPLGNPNKPAVLMIPGIFCTSDMPELAAKYLQQDFYCILPTLDGHAEEPIYRDKETGGRKNRRLASR